MQQIQQISNSPNQQIVFNLQDGSTVSMTIYFVPMQYGWFITSLTYGDFQLNGLRITVSPNMLQQWKNVLPFGLACISPAGREPTQQNDFVSNASQLYVLTPDEVEQYTEFLGGA